MSVVPVDGKFIIEKDEHALRSYLWRFHLHRETPPSKEEAARWAGAKQDIWKNILPINLRCLEGVDWGRLDVKRSDKARDLEPKYVVE
jgi:hypothetical protein